MAAAPEAATSSATSMNVPSGDNSRKAALSAAANSSARAPSVCGEQMDMEKARPTMSSAVRAWRMVTDKPSSCGEGGGEQKGS